MGEIQHNMKKIRQLFTILITVTLILGLCCGSVMAEESVSQTSSSSSSAGQSEDSQTEGQDINSSEIVLEGGNQSPESGNDSEKDGETQDTEEDVPGKNTGMSTANPPEQDGVTEGLEISLSVSGLENEAEAMSRDFRFVIEKYVEEEASQAVTPEQRAAYDQKYTVAELFVKDSDRFNTMTWDEETKTAVYTMKADQLHQLDYGRYLVKLDTTSEKIEEKSSEGEFTGYYEVTGDNGQGAAGETGTNEFREDVGFLIVIGPDEGGTGKVIRAAEQDDTLVGDCAEDEASRIIANGVTTLFTMDSLVGSSLVESLGTSAMAVSGETEPTRVKVLLNYGLPRQTLKGTGSKKNEITKESIKDELTGASNGEGNVLICNYSDFTEEELPGTKLEMSGTKSEIWTTIQNKHHAIINLPAGSYTVAAKSVPDGYNSGDAVTFTVDSDGTVKVGGEVLKRVTAKDKDDVEREYYKVEIFQKAQTVPIDIYKVNSNGETVGGADLSILLPSGKELRNWQTTMGKLRRIDLASGEYILHENSAPEGLKIASDINFSVDGSGKLIVGGEQADKVNMVDEGTSRGKNPDGSTGEGAAPTAAPTSANSKATQVKTGDESKTSVWVVMLGVLSCLLCSFVLLKKNQEKKAAMEAAEELKESAEESSTDKEAVEDIPEDVEEKTEPEETFETAQSTKADAASNTTEEADAEVKEKEEIAEDKESETK